MVRLNHVSFPCSRSRCRNRSVHCVCPPFTLDRNNFKHYPFTSLPRLWSHLGTIFCCKPESICIFSSFTQTQINGSNLDYASMDLPHYCVHGILRSTTMWIGIFLGGYVPDATSLFTDLILPLYQSGDLQPCSCYTASVVPC